MSNDELLNLGIMAACGLAGALGWFRWVWGLIGGLVIGAAIVVGLAMLSGRV